MKRSVLYLVSVFLLTGCFVARPRYSPPTDAVTGNLKGSVEQVRSRYISVDDQDPDDPARSTEFDMVIVSLYNRQGNIVREETYSGGGERLSQRDIYTYDDSGLNLVSSESHDMLKNTVNWIHYKYDDKGRLEDYYAVGGDWFSTLEYGRRGYPVRLITFVKDTVSTTTFYRYDRRGRLRSEGGYRYTYKGKTLREKSRPTYREEYDANGDMVRTVHSVTDTSGSAPESEYEGVIDALYRYDDLGNWTRRELYMNGKLFGVWIREIDYYDPE